ncbi:type II toxin-antitoxin system HicA family toxin [Candidatus Micrarchaeota archaeon]|nr:type II toxin-antitoxin system HicA family toxin [Candidatus Micrarchaeota archaeon]
MKLPVISGFEMIKLLGKLGFRQLDQTGSHVIMFREDERGKFRPVVPLSRELAIGTMLSIIKQAGLNRDEFLEIYYGKKYIK